MDTCHATVMGQACVTNSPQGQREGQILCQMALQDHMEYGEEGTAPQLEKGGRSHLTWTSAPA